MKLDIIFPEFFTWTWNYSYGMVNAASELGVLNKVINLSTCTEKDIYSIGDTNADALLFFGGCEHSPRLYDSRNKLLLLKSITIPKIAIIVESFEFDELDEAHFPTIARHKKECMAHGEFFSHLITSDENDIKPLREKFSNKTICWLPQCVDDRIFFPSSIPKLHEIVFVGSLYRKRKVVLDGFSRLGINIEMMKTIPAPDKSIINKKINNLVERVAGKIEVINLIYSRYLENKYLSTKRRNTILLNNLYNQIKLNINFPGPHKGLTSRVFEVMATGGVLIQPRPIDRSDSESLFEDMVNIIYYDTERLEDSIEKINSLFNNSKLLLDIGYEARKVVEGKHSCRKRLEDYIKIINEL